MELSQVLELISTELDYYRINLAGYFSSVYKLCTLSNVTGIEGLILLQILLALLDYKYLRRAYTTITDNVDLP